jgi:hypothetical protein
MANPHLDSLQKLQSSLLQMHRYMLASLKSDREARTRQPISPTDWFHLILSEPEYSWMRPITGLMSDIDALMDNYEVAEEDLRIIRQELEGLFLIPSENPADFSSKYQDMVRQDPDVMLYHGLLRQLIRALPEPQGIPLDTRQTRRNWHQRKN